MRSITTYAVAIVLSVALTAGLFTGPAPVQAAAFDAGNLISDSLFTARDSMTAADIQTFLVQKGSVLATVPSEYLGDGAAGRSAAQIIYDVTRASVSGFGGSNRPSNPFTVSMNPQVILATLQKETSLITGSYTIGSSTLNSLLRIAMGYGCPDGGGCNEAYAGFTNQVLYGSAQLWLDSWRAGNGTATGYAIGSQQSNTNNPVYNPYCPSGGTITLTVANAATSSLYRYTPHVCNGNANFWANMNNWFPSRVNRFLSEARLLRVAGQAEVYAYWPRTGLRYYVTTAAALSAWGLTGKTIEEISLAELIAINQGTGTLNEVSRAYNAPDVFFMERGYKRYVRSYSVLADRGLSEANVSAVDDSLINEFFEGPPVGGFARENYNPDVYLTSWAWKFYIDDLYTINNFGFKESEVRVLEPGSLGAWSTVNDIEWLVRQYNHPDVYVVSSGQKLYVPSADMLRHWGLTSTPNRLVGPDIMNQLPRGKTLSRVAKGSGPDVYVVENGTRRYVRAWSRLNGTGLKSTDLVQVSDPILYRLPLGKPL